MSMKLEEIRVALGNLESAIVDMTEARRVNDADEEYARVNTLRHSLLMRIQNLVLICECGRELNPGLCSICDNDE